VHWGKAEPGCGEPLQETIGPQYGEKAPAEASAGTSKEAKIKARAGIAKYIFLIGIC